MTKLIDLWTTVETLMPTPVQIFGRAIRETIEAQGLQDIPFGMLNHVHQLQEHGFTMQKIEKSSPHHAPALLRERVDTLVDAGLAKAGPDGTYTLTEKGTRALESIFEAAEATLAEYEKANPYPKVTRLSELISRLNDAALKDPAENMRLHMQNTYPLDYRKSHLSHINDVAANLHNFRLDVHHRAFEKLACSGPAVEVLGLLWREQANTPEAVTEFVGTRGYTAEDYAGFLDELVTLGWAVNHDDGTYAITDAGKAVRQQVEDETDEGFFKVWKSVLNEEESEELAALSAELVEQIKASVVVESA